jgi:hypothetical protein
MKRNNFNQPTEVVSQETTNQNQKGENMNEKYAKIKYSITETYKVMRDSIKIVKKDKKSYKESLKKVEKSLEDGISISYLFLKNNMGDDSCSLLGVMLMFVFNASSDICITDTNYMIDNKLMEDKSFMIFYKKILIYRELVCDNSELTYQLNYYMSDIRSLILMYFFISENNISETKVLNVLSYFFKNSIIILNEKDMTDENIEKIRLITTGTKYEKIKENKFPTNDPIVRKKSKSKRFDLLQYLSTRIRIKYLSKQDYNHRFHKRPIEHKRSGHYRHNKNGTKTWIKPMVINVGISKSTKEENTTSESYKELGRVS